MNIFFGAGKIGRRYLEFWRKLHLQVDYFMDNNIEMIGNNVDGVEVVSTNWLEEYQDEIYIYITCASVDEIIKQLADMNVPKMKVQRISDIVTLAKLEEEYGTDFLKEILDISTVEPMENGGSPRILFDLQNGLALGGVESWSFQSARKLETMGYHTMFLNGRENREVTEVPKEKLCMIDLLNNVTEWERIKYAIIKIAEKETIIICNFPAFHFAAACFAKSLFPDRIRIIAVLHSDDEVYYNAYLMMKNHIDKCLVVSHKIHQTLISRGISENKCLHLSWRLLCDKNFKKVYSVEKSMIHLGYAGRIVQAQKRVDCLVEIAERLKERGLTFKLEIAGKGDYQNILVEEISKRNLDGMVHYIGMLKREDISTFWKRQDIMISCSEIEGHSISQSEAMAEGVVPIITDVSGARDDVTDGYNGFVVDIGDIKTMTERICYLYNNRDVLKVMGNRAHKVIYNRQKNMDEAMFWSDLLMEISV